MLFLNIRKSPEIFQGSEIHPAFENNSRYIVRNSTRDSAITLRILSLNLLMIHLEIFFGNSFESFLNKVLF